MWESIEEPAAGAGETDRETRGLMLCGDEIFSEVISRLCEGELLCTMEWCSAVGTCSDFSFCVSLLTGLALFWDPNCVSGQQARSAFDRKGHLRNSIGPPVPCTRGTGDEVYPRSGRPAWKTPHCKLPRRRPPCYAAAADPFAFQVWFYPPEQLRTHALPGARQSRSGAWREAAAALGECFRVAWLRTAMLQNRIGDQKPEVQAYCDEWVDR